MANQNGFPSMSMSMSALFIAALFIAAFFGITALRPGLG